MATLLQKIYTSRFIGSSLLIFYFNAIVWIFQLIINNELVNRTVTINHNKTRWCQSLSEKQRDLLTNVINTKTLKFTLTKHIWVLRALNL